MAKTNNFNNNIRNQESNSNNQSPILHPQHHYELNNQWNGFPINPKEEKGKVLK